MTLTQMKSFLHNPEKLDPVIPEPAKDRNIVDSLYEPMVHMIRNSVDRLLHNENFFKFKAENLFDHRHIGHIPRIKLIYQRRNWINWRCVTACRSWA